MTFLWPSMLATLLVVPVVVVVYLRMQRRRALAARAFGSGSGTGGEVGRGREASGRQRRGGPGLRRHLPSLLFLVGLVVVLVALARPQAEVTLPKVEGTVMLVFDVSASMGATDAQPSRLEAAKVAARDFVLSQPSTVKIGVVAFNGSGFTVQAPTEDQNALLGTIGRLQPNSGTSLGQGMLTALNAIAVDKGLSKGEATTGAGASTGTGAAQSTPQPSGQAGQGPGPSQADRLASLPEGTYPASTIVLLSDGENNQGIDPVEVAKAAATHGVRVDALGFGTTAGATINVGGYRVHTALDEGELERITQVAGGVYYAGQGEQDPKQVYASLTPQVVVKPEVMEVTSLFAGASMVLLLMGSLFSMLWFRRLP